MIRIERREHDWKVLRVDDGGERVSWTRVPALQVRIAGAVLPAGGIAGLRTADHARGRGYATDVMNAALDLMVEQGMGVSLLLGIPNFYHRWQYRTIIPPTRLKVATRALEAHLDTTGIPGQVSHRPYDAADAGAVLRWHERDNRTRTGTLVRRAGSWQGFGRGSDFGKEPEVQVLEQDGAPQAYVVLDAEFSDRLVVAELGCRRWPLHLPRLLRFVVQEAVRRRNGAIRFHIPVDHPAAHYLRAVGGKLEVIYHRNRHIMGRIIDLDAVARAMTPVWAQRLRQSPWRTAPCRLQIQTQLAGLRLDWDGETLAARLDPAEASGHDAGAPGQLNCPQDLLCAALFGQVPGSALPLLGAGAAGADPALLDCLFPQQQPFLWSVDWF